MPLVIVMLDLIFVISQRKPLYQLGSADPSPIFSNAYSGDWISQINFDSTGF